MWKDLEVGHIVHLTDEQVQEYIEKEKLVRGIPIELDVPVAPKDARPPYDGRLYSFKGLYFEDIESARKLADLAYELGAMDYDSYSRQSYRSNYRKIENRSSYKLQVDEQDVWYPETEKTLPSDKVAYERELKEYEEAVKVYQEHRDALVELTEEINNVVWHFRKMYNKVGVLVDKFAAYLEKSDGSPDRAFAYFEMAYSKDIRNLIDKSEYAEEYKSEKFFYDMFFLHTGARPSDEPRLVEEVPSNE